MQLLGASAPEELINLFIRIELYTLLLEEQTNYIIRDTLQINADSLLHFRVLYTIFGWAKLPHTGVFNRDFAWYIYVTYGCPTLPGYVTGHPSIPLPNETRGSNKQELLAEILYRRRYSAGGDTIHWRARNVEEWSLLLWYYLICLGVQKIRVFGCRYLVIFRDHDKSSWNLWREEALVLYNFLLALSI